LNGIGQLSFDVAYAVLASEEAEKKSI